MLRQEDLKIEVGRCEGGSFMRVVHLPTGTSRHKGPLAGESSHSIKTRFLNEIEQELIDQGLLQHIVPTYRKRHRDI